MQYHTYIIDVEEVIADLSECYSKAFSSVFAEFGMPFDIDRLDEYVSQPLDGIFSQYYTGCTCKFRDFVTKFIGEFDRAFAAGFRIREGVTGRVRGLRAEGAKVCAVSDLFSVYAESILSAAGIRDCVDIVFAAERMAVKRPDPYCISSIMREIGSDAGSTVLVATGETNAECARRAGVGFLTGLD